MKKIISAVLVCCFVMILFSGTFVNYINSTKAAPVKQSRVLTVQEMKEKKGGILLLAAYLIYKALTSGNGNGGGSSSGFGGAGAGGSY